MRRSIVGVVLFTAACGGGGSGAASHDSLPELVARLNAAGDSIVREAMTREGVAGFEPPPPGLSDTYLRYPRRNAQVKRYYDGWSKVDGALSPTIYLTMRDVANRLRREADLSERDSMNFDVEVESAIRNRRREIELRGMIADIAISLYDQENTPGSTMLGSSSRDRRVQTQRDNVTDRMITNYRAQLDRYEAELRELIAARTAPVTAGE